MIITIFHFINNYYYDESNGGIKSEYSTFGYYDGLKIFHSDNITEDLNINEHIKKVIVDNYDGTCNRRNIVCYTNEAKKAQDFWKQAEQHRYLFVSLIRLKKIDNIYERKKVEGEINKISEAMYMYSYDHSELVIVLYGDMYYGCLDLNEKIQKQIDGVLKSYTFSSVREKKISESCDDELVSVHLRCTVKSKDKINNFMNELLKKLGMNVQNIKTYKLLGNEDLLIEMEKVSMNKLLECYVDEGILNHRNELYSANLYNIETEIIKEVKIKDGD